MWQSGTYVSEDGPAAAAASAASSGPTPPAETVAAAVAALVEVQRQLAEVIRPLSDDEYRQRPVGVVPSSIGGHVRHCLDHVAALLAAAASGTLNYDHRRRDTAIETDRRAALAAVGEQERSLARLAVRSPHEPLRLSTLVAADGPPLDVGTTLGRELSFVLSHTVHHNSLVSTMVRLMGGDVPPRFGYAPATVAYLEQQACAR